MVSWWFPDGFLSHAQVDISIPWTMALSFLGWKSEREDAQTVRFWARMMKNFKHSWLENYIKHPKTRFAITTPVWCLSSDPNPAWNLNVRLAVTVCADWIGKAWIRIVVATWQHRKVRQKVVKSLIIWRYIIIYIIIGIIDYNCSILLYIYVGIYIYIGLYIPRSQVCFLLRCLPTNQVLCVKDCLLTKSSVIWKRVMFWKWPTVTTLIWSIPGVHHVISWVPILSSRVVNPFPESSNL